MNSVGKVLRFSSTGTIVMRSDTAPQIGRMVCDMRGRDIGKIIRVTGPVSRPYTIVKPLKDLPEGINRLLGKELYLSRPVERQRPAPDRRRDDGRPPRKDQGHFKKGPGGKNRDKPSNKPDRRQGWIRRG